MKRFSLLLALALVAGAPAFAASTNVDTNTVTFAEHVAPIFFENCVSCHRPGQTAPMSLLSYDEARPWAKSIQRVTADGVMPPWFANPAHGDFKEDSRLSAEEIDVIGRWVRAGAPAGDLARMPQAPAFESEWKIGKPDLILTMEPFVLSDELEDHYEWRSIVNPLTEDRWIKAIEVKPSFLAGTHHNLTFVVPEGKGQEALGENRDLLVGWAPGAQPFHLPEGRGKVLPAKGNVMFQMHYHKTPGPGTGGVDATQVAIQFHEPGYVPKPIKSMWVLDPMIRIPPGEANYVSESEFVFEDDGIVYNFLPHMHVRGKSFTYTVIYPDGRSEVLLDVPRYDFNWQLTYTPREPLHMPKGTKIHCRAVFDNSTATAANPDPTIEVTWGEKTTDEMMIGFMEYEYVNQTEMPTFSVPPHVREQMQRRFQQRQQTQPSAEGSGAAANSGPGAGGER